MAEKNDNDNHFSLKKSNTGNETDNGRDDDGDMTNSAAYYQSEGFVGDENPSNALESKKEGNPFSFKRFLNQDAVNHRLQNFRRTNYSPDNVASCNENGSIENQNYNYIGMDNSSKVLNTNDMASVLPDFVQDHLVIEQCYLNSSSSTINIDTLNLHNLPDLNVEHRQGNNDSQRNDINHHVLSGGISNLPDCTPDMRDYCGRSDLDGFSGDKTLPDFTVNTSGVSRTAGRDNDEFFPRDNSTKRKNVQRNPENNQSNRCNPRMSSSPSVPLDLPSYDGAEGVSVSSISLEQPIPFDLTVAAEDRNGSYRGMPSTETVSKSLPDFLSDGPIQNDRLGENLQHMNLVSSLHDNDDQRTSHPENDSFERSRMERELVLLRRELAEKNRRIHQLESEIADIHSQERRESSNLEHALHLQTERNLRQALERASKAEAALMKSRLENNQLRMKLYSLRVENSSLQPDGEMDASRGRDPSQRIAQELRIAADAAESSLRSLLTGIDSLRTIAASIENIQIYNEKTDDMDDYNNEDSASGPAL